MKLEVRQEKTDSVKVDSARLRRWQWLLAAVLSLAAFSLPAATKYAICVGINQYTNPGCNPLTGCVKDAENMYSLLVEKGGWSSGNVKKMLNSSATQSAVANAIANFASKAVAGDTFVYTQSSHGDQNALCMYNTNFSAADFGAALRQFATGVKVVCIIDTCYSGSMANKGAAKTSFDIASFVSAASASIDALNANERGLTRNITKYDVGWCCAAGLNQTSLDASVSQGAQFTYPLFRSAYVGAADATQFSAETVEANGDVYLSKGDGDGKCSAYEAFWYARSQLEYFKSISPYEGPGAGNYGNEGDADEHIPQIFNENVCKGVILSENSGLERVSKVLTAYGIDFRTVENFGYEWEENHYMAGGFVAKNGVGVSGGLALQAAPTRNFGSCRMDVPVSGSGTVSFKWKVSSLPTYGVLEFYVDGNEQAARKISGTGGGWSEISYTIDAPGDHVLTWEYYRGDAEVAGEDTGWIDQISWQGGSTPGPSSDINTCLGNQYLQFSQQNTENFPAWMPYENSLMTVASGGREGLAMISATVTGPCIVDFDWVCYSPNGKSAVLLLMDGDIVTEGNIGGSRSSPPEGLWEEFVVVPEGQHELSWTYLSTEAGSSSANDLAIIDRIAVHYQLVFSPGDGSGSVTMPGNYTYSGGDEYYYEVGSEIVLPNADSLSYEYGTFRGWDCNGVVYDPGSGFQMPMAPTTITAKWGENESSDSFMLSYADSGFFAGKGTYNGYVLEGDSVNWACGAVIGFATIKTAKMKNGASSVTLTLDLRGEKKTLKFKGSTSWSPEHVNLATATLIGDGGIVKMNLTHKNVWAYLYMANGGQYFLDASRQFSRDSYADRVKAAKKNYKMACFSYPQSGNTFLGESFVGLSLQAGSSGKTKISGVLPDQTKVSGSVNLVIDDLGVYLPVFSKINSKKGSFGGFLLSCADCQPVLTTYGLWDGMTAKYPLEALLAFEAGEICGGNPKTTWYMFEAFGTIPDPYNDTQVFLSEFPGWTEYEYLTFDVKKKKWLQLNPDQKKMTLSYAAKTGIVKGSFKFLTMNGKKNSAVVNGIYFDSLAQDGLVPCSISVKGKLTLYGMLQ